MKQGWEKQYFENCFKLKSGDNLTAKNMSENGSYPVFGGNGIAGYHNEFNLSGSNVIIGRVGALCGNVRHITENIWLTDNAFKIVDFKFDFDHSFLTYLLNYKDLRSFARQAAQPVISNSSLKDVVLQFPKSVKEQQRIVSILDEAFAAIAKAKANAEQNLKNAKELFESYLQGVFENGDWESKKWKEVLEIRSGRNQKEVEDPDGQYPILGSAGKVMGYANNFICEEGTTIVGRKGTIDNPMYIEEKFWNVDTAFGLHALNQLDKRFLFYFCRSYDFTKQDKGSGRPSLVKSDLLQIKMPIPPLKEQQTIVRQLDAMRAKTQRLEAIYQQKLLNLEELKKSVLQKAFNGELITEKLQIL